MKKNGFTLVEILIVMAILVMMSAIMIGIFNTIGVMAKGRDAQRKKDLNRIKVAFEEYFNDKGYFPTDYYSWNIKANCKSGVFAPYLNSWPCDPNGEPYHIHVQVETNKFRIITNLENKKDKDIPNGWYIKNDFSFPELNLDTNSANYGVSSSNILWYDGLVHDYSLCDIKNCFTGENGCNHVDFDIGCKDTKTCFYAPAQGGDCLLECRVNCCGDGCN